MKETAVVQWVAVWTNCLTDGILRFGSVLNRLSSTRSLVFRVTASAFFFLLDSTTAGAGARVAATSFGLAPAIDCTLTGTLTGTLAGAFATAAEEGEAVGGGAVARAREAGFETGAFAMAADEGETVRWEAAGATETGAFVLDLAGGFLAVAFRFASATFQFTTGESQYPSMVQPASIVEWFLLNESDISSLTGGGCPTAIHAFIKAGRNRTAVSSRLIINSG